MKHLLFSFAAFLAPLSFGNQSLIQCNEVMSRPSLQQEICENHRLFYNGVSSVGIIHDETHRLYEDKSPQQYQDLGITDTSLFAPRIRELIAAPFSTEFLGIKLATSLLRPGEYTLVKNMLGFKTHSISTIAPVEVLISLSFIKGEIAISSADTLEELAIESWFSLYEYQAANPVDECNQWPRYRKIPEVLTKALANRPLGLAFVSASSARKQAITNKIDCPSDSPVDSVYLVCYYNPLIRTNNCPDATKDSTEKVQLKEPINTSSYQLLH